MEDLAPLRSLEVVADRISKSDGTNKILFRAADGGLVESVLMSGGPRSSPRFTVCVSCQIGCPAGCSFCASGIAGFGRNLTTAEIADQVELFAGRLRAQGKRLDNVVYMGMGEPFLNYNRVMASIRLITRDGGLGLGTRRVTVSTVGIVPGIRRFAREPGEVNLAISLHAPDAELRRSIVPYEERYPIGEILEAARDYVRSTRRRVSFEYVLLRNTNDGLNLAGDLGRLLTPLRPLAHVNLIPWNPFGDAGFSASTRERADRFAAAIRVWGIPATVRYSKGLDIDAACGQLRMQSLLQQRAS